MRRNGLINGENTLTGWVYVQFDWKHLKIVTNDKNYNNNERERERANIFVICEII